ncbi:hypothetical protein TorRG33x02_177820 [Trema orientale]|uniref:CLAVATA3/ESR (CLE)-related protein n=1 Tax=Trema orientale TaxID=63057 RepID=A0A2P5ELM7_TREOI|nr:hypothetical protein TorRG33x02_177820 [Trema orientale]
MGVQNHKLPCMVMIIILMISQFSSCRHINKARSESTNKTDKSSKFYSQFSWHLSAKAPEESREYGINPRYGASLRAVPGGPNPLHN